MGAFIGSEAIGRGEVTEHDLRRWYRAIFRGVYVPRGDPPSLRDRTIGAWLKTGEQAVIAGAAASALHGALWVDDDAPIELIGPNVRRQSGLIVRNEAFADDEITEIAGLRVTTPARTAYDLGRHLPESPAVARLDALIRAAPFSIEDVLILAKRYAGARGVCRLRVALPLVDDGSESPRESKLRVLLIRAGFPRPTTQIPVLCEGRVGARLDMGWEEYEVAAEYDGDDHRSNRARYVADYRRLEFIRGEGWDDVRVVKEDRPARIIDRVDRALRRRGWRP